MKKTVLSAALAGALIMAQAHLYPQGEKAANVAIYHVDGKRSVLYGLLKDLPRDGVLILNFTSVHCKPCKKEIPELARIAATHPGRVVLICLYAETGDPVRESAASLGVLPNAYVDPLSSVQAEFNVKSYPVTVLIAGDGAILGRFEGYTRKNIQDIETITGGKKGQ
jgi:thiol-disulfide isomerase/thioredoxin